MSSSIRTALTGLGALAACLAVYFLKWEHLLSASAALGVAWAAFTWHRHGRKVETPPQEPIMFPGRGRRGPSNIYSFPQRISGASDA